MSKAFTREDDRPGPRMLRRLPSALPPGARNYVTPAGLEALRTELARLVEEERPRAATTKDESVLERLEVLDERVQHLRQSLESALVVIPPTEDDDRVRFGATVTVREQPGGKERHYRIVGIDEADTERAWVSWVSPIAKALLTARVGDTVQVRLPPQGKELEVVDIVYE